MSIIINTNFIRVSMSGSEPTPISITQQAGNSFISTHREDYVQPSQLRESEQRPHHQNSSKTAMQKFFVSNSSRNYRQSSKEKQQTHSARNSQRPLTQNSRDLKKEVIRLDRMCKFQRTTFGYQKKISQVNIEILQNSLEIYSRQGKIHGHYMSIIARIHQIKVNNPSFSCTHKLVERLEDLNQKYQRQRECIDQLNTSYRGRYIQALQRQYQKDLAKIYDESNLVNLLLEQERQLKKMESLQIEKELQEYYSIKKQLQQKNQKLQQEVEQLKSKLNRHLYSQVQVMYSASFKNFGEEDQEEQLS